MFVFYDKCFVDVSVLFNIFSSSENLRNACFSLIKNISLFCGNIPDQHFNVHLAKKVWFLNSSNILWSDQPWTTLQVSRGIFISSFICEPLMSRLGSSMLTSPSPLSPKMSPTSLVFGSHRFLDEYFPVQLSKLTNDHSWVRLTATTGRLWWLQGAAPSFTLDLRESSSRSTLKVSSTSTTKTTTAASGHNHFWNLTWNIVHVRSERGSCYVEFQTDANHFMLEPVSTKRGGGAKSKSHLSEKAKADICEEL